jgi:hypothetical protein
MFIGEIAAEAGVTVQTVRFYERRGLMRRAARQRLWGHGRNLKMCGITIWRAVNGQLVEEWPEFNEQAAQQRAMTE